MTSSLPLSSRNGLYAGLATLGVAGGAWMICAGTVAADATPCPFKLVTGLACPACGSTRAVLALFEGGNPLQYNPVGLVTFAVALAALLVMLRDLITGADTLLRWWRRAEQWLSRPPVALAGTSILVANWIWTISKGL